MSVSGKDRGAAVAVMADWTWGGKQLSIGNCNSLLDRLISHGWGPRPTVDAGELDGFALRADGGQPASAVRALRGYLRECGIEVTDD